MSCITTSMRSFRSALPAVVFVVLIFFLNFLTRVIVTPLMPVLEVELGFNHGAAGAVFLVQGAGNAIGLLLSGFISREINHNKTVGWSAIAVGLFSLGFAHVWSYGSLLGAMFALGVSVGLYLPSGIAAVTSLVRPADWGKTIAVHEGAPNMAFIVAPLLAEAALLFAQWRMAVVVLAAAQLVVGVFFLCYGKGGAYPGVSPISPLARSMLRRPVFWLLIFCFSTAVGLSVGPYSMMPLYLVDNHGFSREGANQLLSLSRIAAVFVPIFSGWFTDRWGVRPVLTMHYALCGLATIALGVGHGWVLIAAVVLQPVFSVLFFTPAFTLVARFFDHDERTVAISFIGPVNAFLGVGIIPWTLGMLGQVGCFSIGFILQGLLCLLSFFLLPLFPKVR